MYYRAGLLHSISACMVGQCGRRKPAQTSCCFWMIFIFQNTAELRHRRHVALSTGRKTSLKLRGTNAWLVPPNSEVAGDQSPSVPVVVAPMSASLVLMYLGLTNKLIDWLIEPLGCCSCLWRRLSARVRPIDRRRFSSVSAVLPVRLPYCEGGTLSACVSNACQRVLSFLCKKPSVVQARRG